jgi:3-oxoacyl-[acyl-carrier protein] reductase
LAVLLTELDPMHRTNIRGTFVVDQQAARRVRTGGAVINVSSSVVKIALTGYTAYTATKGRCRDNPDLGQGAARS